MPRLENTELGKVWLIQVCPAFEVKKARESEGVASAPGIYQYKRAGEVVYIGRGNVRGRLGQSSRKDWDFDTVEYSLLSDCDEQVKWEDHWIEKYKETHDGLLPIYNQISGAGTFRV